MNKLENLKKKILYRANYKGSNEIDIILGNFVDQYIDKLSLLELNDLNKFLNYEDELIYNFYQNNFINEEFRS